MLARLLMLFALLAFGQTSLAQDSVQTLDPPATEAAGAATLPQPPAPPPPCGTQPLAIARMSWPSAALLAEIHSRLLTAHYLCNIAIQEGDPAQTGSSMGSNGQPAVAPEMWTARVADIWNAAMKSQNVRQAGTPYTDTVFEGWFVPDYAAAQWPEITTIDGLKAHAAEFGDGNGRGKFISCPIDWGCAVINRNMLKAYGLDQMFDIVEPANRYELDTLIAEAVGRHEPILFYYWQPNAVLAQFAFRPVTLAAYDRDAFLCMGRVACALPVPTGFAPDPVVVAVAEWVFLDAPQVAGYFGRARMPFEEMNRMLQQLGLDGETVESVADRFVAERGEIWRPWVGLPAIEKPLEAPVQQ